MKTASRQELPIGVFDSGLGGLTVVREIRRRFPNEAIIYLGDNARVPYGTRSADTVRRYARNCAGFLLDHGPKIVVVACNTVSAVALPAIREMTDVPVLGVIEAGARVATATGATRVGVIGTAGTIRSNAYPERIAALAPACAVFQKATPLFVPLAEEGWTDGEVPESVAAHYLEEVVRQKIELLLLGCTHYPLLMGTIRRVLARLGSTALVIDSATAMADQIHAALTEEGLGASRPCPADLTCYVTDRPESFETSATRFLGAPPGDVHLIDIS